MEQEKAKVADYFAVVGLPDDNPEPADISLREGLTPKSRHFEPITDVTVIFPEFEEDPPEFTRVDKTPTGYAANLNSGSLKSPEVYLCIERGRDKPPLEDIGVMYYEKERLLPDSKAIMTTPGGRDANVNNSTRNRTLITFRRVSEKMPCNTFVVADVCIILPNKGERPPHGYCLIPKNLNRGMFGHDVYLCYKKTRNQPPLLMYKPKVLTRYPSSDLPTCPFPKETAMFCLPTFARIECWPDKALKPRPSFSTFVLPISDSTAENVYGAAVTFYEAYSEEKLGQQERTTLGNVSSENTAKQNVYVNKCICVLSRFPFFEAFRKSLLYLHWMVQKGSHEIPVEKVIVHLLEETPLPTAKWGVTLMLSPVQKVTFPHFHSHPLPTSGASFISMLCNLGIENCLLITLLALTEQRILVNSMRPATLTSVVEAISMLIFPFRWQHYYMPSCPLELCSVLRSPFPFLVGVDSEFFDKYEPPNDVTCVDIDTTDILVSEDGIQNWNVNLLPKNESIVLRRHLEKLKLQVDSLLKSKGKEESKNKLREIEVRIQEAFLRFITKILENYRSFLVPSPTYQTAETVDNSIIFDSNAFILSKDKNCREFYELMTTTKMFKSFVDECVSNVPDKSSNVAFFNECIDEMVRTTTPDTVNLVRISESEKTLVVMPPASAKPTGTLAATKFSYDGIFNLQPDLFTNDQNTDDKSINSISESNVCHD